MKQNCFFVVFFKKEIAKIVRKQKKGEKQLLKDTLLKSNNAVPYRSKLTFFYYYCCYCYFAFEIKTSILSSLDSISSFTWCPFDYNTELVCQFVPMPRAG